MAAEAKASEAKADEVKAVETKTTVTETKPLRKEPIIKGDKIKFSPRVVHLGGSLPLSALHYVTELWIPNHTESQDSRTKQKNSRTSPRYKNLYEYQQRHKNQFNLKQNSWKLPGYSNNVLPTYKNRRSNFSRESGSSERQFQQWYHKFAHEDSVVLPPLISARTPKLDPLNESPTSRSPVLTPRRAVTQKKGVYQSELYLPNLNRGAGADNMFPKHALTDRQVMKSDRSPFRRVYRADMTRACAQTSTV